MNKSLFYILFTLSIAIRFFYFGEDIDSPHTWRQSDTANYIWDYYDNGIDLGKPSVCWMGGHKTVILEFPIVEGLIASLYHIFGPTHQVARFVFLLFFIGSCWFLYQIILFFLSRSTARLSVLFYSLMPLSMFYSRAIHIDYSEMFFALGMVYFYLKGIQNEKILPFVFGGVFCALAFMIKAPYAMLFAIPLGWFILSQKKLLFFLKKIHFFILPILIYWVWQKYVFEVNDAAPEWGYVPGYRKFTFNAGWYFGDLNQRFTLDHYVLFGERFYNEILGLLGLILMVISFFLIKKKHLFFVYWLLGCIVYVMVFFNLNRVHNYYQIPFTAILSIFMAIGLVGIIKNYAPLKRNLLLLIVVLLFTYETTSYAHSNYYKVQTLYLEIGRYVKRNTQKDDLVIINFENYDSKCPNFHYPAKRNGWVIPDWGLNEEVIKKLMNENAGYFATARKKPLKEIDDFLEPFRVKKQALQDGYYVYLYQLKP